MSQRADRGDRVPPARAPIAMLARARFVGIALAMTLSASCATPRSRLSVAPSWRGDFETGDSSQWSYILNPRGLSVVAAPVAEGRRAARVEIRPGDLWPNGLNRVELEHKPEPATVAEGKASFFAWSFFVPV
ncbi:MAG TPA: heparin lyase I family protein, partial [Polyangia bacterium]